jgi:hypothetical protein
MSESSGLTPLSSATGNMSLSPITDPDSKPFGRCHAEYLAVKVAFAELNAASQKLRAVVDAFGDCRAAAFAEAGKFAATGPTGFDMSIDLALSKIEINASIIEDIVTQACSECSEDNAE